MNKYTEYATYATMCINYGIIPLSFEAEVNLPETKKQIRCDKIDIINNCEKIKAYIDSIENVTRCAPELDDEKHVELLNEYAERIKWIALETEQILNLRYGGNANENE